MSKFTMRSYIAKSLPILVLALSFGGFAVAQTSYKEYVLCVNKKTKAVTFAPEGRCSRNSDLIRVGTQVVKQSNVKSMPSSYNAVLRDASGSIVEGLIRDGIIFRDGYVWSLDYSTGEFRPSLPFVPLYLNPRCTGEVVASIPAETIKGARGLFNKMKSQASSGYLMMPYSVEGDPIERGLFSVVLDGKRVISQEVFTLSNTAKLIDNRSEDKENGYGVTTLYRPNWGETELCVEEFASTFYVTGVEQIYIQTPSRLPAPLVWSKP